jgi:hypothetical protein
MYSYVWLERKFHMLYNELYNISLSASIKKTLSEALRDMSGKIFKTLYFKNHLTEIIKKGSKNVWL